METQFQPVTVPLVPACIETVNVGLKFYFMAPASEPELTDSEEVQEDIWGHRFAIGVAMGSPISGTVADIFLYNWKKLILNTLLI
jgi:hypothetical protein